MGSPAAVGTRSAHTPCLTAAPRKLPVQPSRRGEACCFLAQRLQLSKQYLPVCRARQQQHTELVAAKHKFWLSLGVISPLTVSPTAARADELTAAAGNAAQAASQAAPDLPPTVTFGGSFGQYDPIIAVFFYAVIAALTVLTLGVGYLSIRNWQDSTDERKERASFSRSKQDRELAEVSVKARARRQPPRSKASKSSNKGFGS